MSPDPISFEQGRTQRPSQGAPRMPSEAYELEPPRKGRWLDRVGDSLGLRLVLLSALPVLAMLAIAGGIVVHEWRASARVAARESAHAYLRTLAQPSARNLAVHALDRLDLDLSDAIGSETEKVRLQSVAIYDWGGHLVARSGRGDYQADDPALTAFVRAATVSDDGSWRQRRGSDNALLLDVAVPAISGVRRGTLVGTFDISGVESASASTTWVIIALAIGVWLLISATIGLSLRLLLVEPIDELARAAAEIRRGQLGARAWVASRDELGRLAGDFNAMADELEAYTVSLERKVEARTAEVQHKNSELEKVNARLNETLAKLERLATEDGLTGVRNRRSFDAALELETQRGARNPHPFCVVLIDVDHFKHYNDTNGHPAGDRALQKVASVLSQAVRATDLLARYGGEEFVVLLLDTDREAGVRVAETLRRAVEASAFEFGASQPLGRLSISVGVAAFPEDGRGPSDLVARADQGLYAAKHQGRNRVVAWSPSLGAEQG